MASSLILRSWRIGLRVKQDTWLICLVVEFDTTNLVRQTAKEFLVCDGSPTVPLSGWDRFRIRARLRKIRYKHALNSSIWRILAKLVLLPFPKGDTRYSQEWR